MTIDTIRQVRQLAASGDHEGVVALCRRALSDRPDDPDILFELAKSHQARGDRPSALACFEQVLDLAQEHTEALYQSANLMLADGRQSDAEARLRQCISIDPNHASARTALARGALEREELDEARSGFRTALRAEPDEPTALLGLAEVSLRTDHIDDAHRYASRALKLTPDDAAAQLTMARVFEAQGHLDFAEQCLRNAGENAPADPRFPRALASLLQRQDRHQSALEAIERAGPDAAADPEILSSRALSLTCVGRFSEARGLYERLISENPEPEHFLQLADLYHEQRDPEALDALHARSAVLPPEMRDWLRALAASVRGNTDEVLKRVRSLLGHGEPERGETRLTMQARLLAAGALLSQRKASGVEEFLAPLAGHPELPGALGWEAARMCRAADLHELAARLLDRLIAMPSLDEQTLQQVNLARLDALDRAGRYAEANELMPEVACRAPPMKLGTARAPAAEAGMPAGHANTAKLGRAASSAITSANGPIFVHGCPHGGRDLMTRALSHCQGVGVLEPERWPRRRESLDLQLSAQAVDALDASRLALIRHRYLRGHRQRNDVRWLEPGEIRAADLPLVARVFPDASVVVMQADDESLELQWRLKGYREVPEMLRQWRDEQAMLDHCRGCLRLNFVDVALAGLTDHPEPALSTAATALGLHCAPGLAEEFAQWIDEFGYRPRDHWQHYPLIADNRTSR